MIKKKHALEKKLSEFQLFSAVPSDWANGIALFFLLTNSVEVLLEKVRSQRVQVETGLYNFDNMIFKPVIVFSLNYSPLQSTVKNTSSAMKMIAVQMRYMLLFLFFD